MNFNSIFHTPKKNKYNLLIVPRNVFIPNTNDFSHAKINFHGFVFHLFLYALVLHNKTVLSVKHPFFHLHGQYVSNNKNKCVQSKKDLRIMFPSIFADFQFFFFQFLVIVWVTVDKKSDSEGWAKNGQTLSIFLICPPLISADALKIEEKYTQGVVHKLGHWS